MQQIIIKMPMGFFCCFFFFLGWNWCNRRQLQLPKTTDLTGVRMVLQQHRWCYEPSAREKGMRSILKNGNQSYAGDMGRQGVRLEGRTQRKKKIQDLSGVIENTLEIETSTPARIFIFIKWQWQPIFWHALIMSSRFLFTYLNKKKNKFPFINTSATPAQTSPFWSWWAHWFIQSFHKYWYEYRARVCQPWHEVPGRREGLSHEFKKEK